VGGQTDVRAARSKTITHRNQWRIIVAAIIGDMLEFFDYFLIGFVLSSEGSPGLIPEDRSLVTAERPGTMPPTSTELGARFRQIATAEGVPAAVHWRSGT
jgi:hypothetical protein